MVVVTPILGLFAESAPGFAYPIMQAATAHHGVRESESAIIKRHERLIRYIALPFARRNADVDDLVQEGRIALLVAARSWRASEGVELWTYAWKFVLGAMFRYVSREIREPSRSHSESDDAALGQLGTSDRAPEGALSMHEVGSILDSELVRLSDVERRVLCLRFVDEISLCEISRMLALSSEDKADRIYHGAIRKLRERLAVRL